VKKLWSRSYGKKQNRAHAKKSLRRRTNWKQWKKDNRRPDGIGGEVRASQRPVQHHRPPRSLVAPVILSLVDSPDESASFFAKMLASKHRDLFVDLSDVRTITPDAIALLLATVKFLDQKRKVYVSGNYPEAEFATETIRMSGFNEYLRTSMPPSANVSGAIIRQDLSLNSKQANGIFARKLVDFATSNQSDESNRSNRLRLKMAYGHLLECMGNTHQHAGNVPGEKTWWASVFRDVRRRCDCFTFIDMGVGIFNSIELSVRLRLYNVTGLLRPRILKELLEGKIPSSTGKSYRGRGLPSIYQSAMAGKIQRLVILTNEVYADTSRDDFRNLATELRGVLLYWEVAHGS
jgi:hypothetical protein